MSPLLDRQRGALRGAALTAVLLLATEACGTPVDGTASSSTYSGDETPSFSGPWAGAFTEAFAGTSAAFVRAILVDESVTDQELSETRDRFSECLTSFGITDITFDADGGFSFNSPEGSERSAVEEDVSTCSAESGEDTVGALHSWVRRNPDNLDENTILAACLVRQEVVDPSFSAEDYAAADGNLPFLDSVSAGAGNAAFLICNSDPLGLFEDGSAPGS